MTITQTLQQVIDEIGGNSEMLGSTELADECLTESAKLIANRGGYAIYELECGDYWLSHSCGSTHLVTTDDLADMPSANEQARVVGAVVNLTGNDLDVVFDNGGGITVQARGFVHSYDDPEQAATDVKGILAPDYDPASWEGDAPEWYQGAQADSEIERNGGYRWMTRADIESAIAAGEVDCHGGYAEKKFFAALGVTDTE